VPRGSLTNCVCLQNPLRHTTTYLPLTSPPPLPSPHFFLPSDFIVGGRRARARGIYRRKVRHPPRLGEGRDDYSRRRGADRLPLDPRGIFQDSRGSITLATGIQIPAGGNAAKQRSTIDPRANSRRAHVWNTCASSVQRDYVARLYRAPRKWSSKFNQTWLRGVKYGRWQKLDGR